MHKHQPLVSIIIPCYNSANYIKETLFSVYQQSYNNFEIIAIDDGSTDDTLNILYEFATKEPRLKVIPQKNTYYIKARVNAIQHAQGDYLVCLDSDDILGIDYLKVCIEAAEKDKELSIVYTDAILFDSQNKPWNLPKFELRRFLLENCIYVTALIRKSHYDAAGGFDINMTQLEDWELFISIIKNGGKIKQIHKSLFYYRQRSDNSSVSNLSNSNKLSDNMLRIYNKHYDFYKKNDIYFQSLVSPAIKQYDEKLKFSKKFKNYLKLIFYKYFNKKRYNKLKNKE